MGSDSENEKSATKEKKKIVGLAPIAKPLAGKKLNKKTLKLIRKAAENKCLKRGVKEVVKTINKAKKAKEVSKKDFKGFCVIAGNISPIDVITHVPLICEENDIPYVYVNSKEELANAGATKRPTCCVLVTLEPAKGELTEEVKKELQSEFDKVVTDVKELHSSLF